MAVLARPRLTSRPRGLRPRLRAGRTAASAARSPTTATLLALGLGRRSTARERLPALQRGVAVADGIDPQAQEHQRIVEVLPPREAGTAAPRAGLDQALVGHEDLPSQLAITPREADRRTDRAHARVDGAIEVLARTGGQLAPHQGREQGRMQHAVDDRVVGLLHVAIERAQQPEQQPLGRQRVAVAGRARGLEQRGLGRSGLAELAQVGSEHVLEQARLEQQLEAAPRRATAQQLVDLFEHSGLAALDDVRRDLEQRGPGLRLEVEVEPRGELHRTDHPHRILAEAQPGIADGADHPRVEVGHAVDEVDDLLGLDVEEQAVDGEVAPARVVFDAAPLVVGGDQRIVFALLRRGAKRAGLDDLRAEEHVGELEAAADDPAVAEQTADRLGRGARRDVEVLGAPPQVEVSDAAADEIGLVAGLQQPADDLERVGVDGVHEHRTRSARRGRP
ncbi:MAG: hypothetical protein U0168_17970 [Nannocystaceae bacterium]